MRKFKKKANIFLMKMMVMDEEEYWFRMEKGHIRLIGEGDCIMGGEWLRGDKAILFVFDFQYY